VRVLVHITATTLLGALWSMHGYAEPPVEAVPPTSPQPVPADTPTAESAAAPAAGSRTNSSDYLIGPGDTLQIFVWRNPELSGTVPVRLDGKISTPLAEDMVAVGKSPTQLARDIEHVLAEYVRSPQVNIIVANALSTYSQVKVLGQVKVPQAVPYRKGLTVLDVILATGGLTDFAAPNRARIVRHSDKGNEEIKIKLGNLLNRGDARQNLELRPGDILIVPQALF
jgi:polysaccharide export outer membrane protein